MLCRVVLCCAVTQEDMGVRSGITHAASKAAGMHRKCTRRLARKPNFGALLSHVHDSGGKDAGGKDAGGVKAEAVVWPPPTEADAETKRTRVKGRWLAMQADAERLKPTVSRVFREVMALVRCRRTALDSTVARAHARASALPLGTAGPRCCCAVRCRFTACG